VKAAENLWLTERRGRKENEVNSAVKKTVASRLDEEEKGSEIVNRENEARGGGKTEGIEKKRESPCRPVRDVVGIAVPHRGE